MQKHLQTIQKLWYTTISLLPMPHIVDPNWKHELTTQLSGGNDDKLQCFLNIKLPPSDVEKFTTQRIERFHRLIQNCFALAQKQRRLHAHIIQTNITIFRNSVKFINCR